MEVPSLTFKSGGELVAEFKHSRESLKDDPTSEKAGHSHHRDHLKIQPEFQSSSFFTD